MKSKLLKIAIIVILTIVLLVGLFLLIISAPTIQLQLAVTKPEYLSIIYGTGEGRVPDYTQKKSEPKGNVFVIYRQSPSDRKIWESHLYINRNNIGSISIQAQKDVLCGSSDCYAQGSHKKILMSISDPNNDKYLSGTDTVSYTINFSGDETQVINFAANWLLFPVSKKESLTIHWLDQTKFEKIQSTISPPGS